MTYNKYESTLFAKIVFMRSLFFLALIFTFSKNVIAQSATITGKVINANSGQALASATLTLIEKSKTETSDQNGNFSFGKLAPGTYSIRCSYGGHVEKIVEEINNVKKSQKKMKKDESETDDVLFFVVDILKEEATVLAYNELTKKIIEKSFEVAVSGDTAILPGVVSRKKQIIPVLKI